MGADITVVRYYSLEALSADARLLSAAEQQALEKINQLVAAGQSLDEVMQFFFDSSAEIFPCDRIGVAFLEDQGRRVVSRWVGARYAPVYLVRGYSEGLAGSSLAEILKHGQTRVIGDLSAYLAQYPQSSSTKLLAREGVGSSMTCPLTVAGRAVGFLFRSSRKTNAYDEHQVYLQSRLAERLSQAAEKSYRIDQLEAANRAYLELLAFAAHELKSPLASIVMDVQTLLGGYLGKLEQTQATKMQSIMRKAEDLLDITRDYLDLSRLEGGGLRLNVQQAVNLTERVIEPVLSLLSTQADAKQMKIELSLPPDNPGVECDPDLIRIVFSNLLNNAIKYGRDRTTIRVSIDWRNQLLLASVWNEGTGFPKEKASALFKRFSRLGLDEFRGIRGTGVGLYIVWQIVQLHGGRCRAASEYGSWAEFAFEIPQPLRIPPSDVSS